MIPLPNEAAEGAPWDLFSSNETFGVVLTRKVRQPARVLQEPLESIEQRPPVAFPVQTIPGISSSTPISQLIITDAEVDSKTNK